MAHATRTQGGDTNSSGALFCRLILAPLEFIDEG